MRVIGGESLVCGGLGEGRSWSGLTGSAVSGLFVVSPLYSMQRRYAGWEVHRVCRPSTIEHWIGSPDDARPRRPATSVLCRTSRTLGQIPD